jgi:AraC-like DNA-binding protein
MAAMTGAELSFRSYRGGHDRHHHPHHQLVLALEGRLALEGEGGGGVVDGGQGVLVRAEAAHAFEGNGRNRFLILDVPAAGAALDRAADRGAALRFFPIRPDLHHLTRFLGLAGGAAEIAAAATPILLATLIEGLAPGDAGPPARIRAALAFLHRNYRRPIGCADVAAAVDLSLARLHPLFRDRVGTTLGDYLADLRLTRARERLAASEESIAGIALEVGYGDQTSFTRSFRRRYGVTPARYRRSRRLRPDAQ